MSLTAQFQTRDYLENPIPGVKFQVIRHRWEAVGGPSEAELIATGQEPALWALGELLRCPLVLTAAEGVPAWWGFVDRVTILKGCVSVTLDLDTYANRVRVRYRPYLPDQDYATAYQKTTWADDLVGQTIYGVKELQGTLPIALSATATNLRANLINAHNLLAAVPAVVAPAPQACGAGSPRVMIHASGWWKTTSWRICDQPAGIIQN